MGAASAQGNNPGGPGVVRGMSDDISLNLKTNTFNPRLYDRDAGDGAAARIVATLKGA